MNEINVNYDPDFIPDPTSLVEVENLILELYRPGSPQRISRVQHKLQALQRSPEGWNLASGLIGSADEKVRFFGALTFTVKLNQASTSLSEEDSKLLLEKLIACLIEWVNLPQNSLGVKKLCSTLVVYFMHFSSSWLRCIKHLVYCLSIGNAASQDILNSVPSISDLVGSLSSDKILALLWFSDALVEEVGKTDATNIKHHKFHERLQANVQDVVELMSIGISESMENTSSDMKLREECMKCYEAWIYYSHKAFIDAAIVLTPLKSLLKPAMACLVEEDLYQVTAELFTEMLTNYSKFLSQDDVQMLFSLLSSSWSQERFNRLIQGDFDFYTIQFGNLLLAFGDAIMPDLAQKTSDVSLQQYLIGLNGLLACNGYAVEEDKIFVPALEFWITFVETAIDALYGGNGEDKSWIATARMHIVQAIQKCWRKIQFPPAEVWDEWDSVDQTNFHEARRDVVDMLQSSYTLIGREILSMFANLVLQSLEGSRWAELEASLFCLGALSDSISDEENDEGSEWNRIVGTILGSQFFDILANPANSIPTRVRQTAVTFIGEFASNFERHPQYLSITLTFLFKAMETPDLARKASQSVYSVCSDCRLLLVPELGAFMQHCGTLSQTTVLDPVVKEKIVGSIAPIIQALPTEEAKIEPVQQLLQFVDQDVNSCIAAANQSDEQEANAAGSSALRCLLSIAKGLQVPADVPVDLEQETPTSSVWIEGAGAPVQNHIMMLIHRVMDALKNSSEIIDIVCHIFRAGFTEREPGPFVFSPALVTQFLLQGNLRMPRPDLFIGTACSFINSFREVRRIDKEASALLAWLVGFLQGSTDVDIATSGIQFLNSLMPAYNNVLLGSLTPQSTEFIFMFTLRALTANDAMPKYAACDFWSVFISQGEQASKQLQISVKNTVDQVGPMLAEAIIYNIGGHCVRSGLNKLTEPLKKMVARQVQSRVWLEAALFRDTFPSVKVNGEDKRIFLQKIINLRGGKDTNQVVREFWLVCKGSNLAYAS